MRKSLDGWHFHIEGEDANLYSNVKTLFVAVSIPRKAEDLGLHTLEKLRNIQREFGEAQLFADKKCARRDEILAATSGMSILNWFSLRILTKSFS